MKNKLLIPLIIFLAIMISACGSNSTNDQTANPSASPSQNVNESGSTEGTSDSITYSSEIGPIDVPANPERIVALTNAPNVLSFNGKLVGVDEWTVSNPLFSERLEGIEIVSEASMEKILGLEPDLIIAGSHMENLEELSKIAPTVVYTWGKLDYLEQQLEIGKLLGKESEAQAWIDDFKQRTEALGREIKSEVGENVSVSVFETDSKSFSVFGNNWARGTEILYQAMGLNMPEKVKQDALGPGYYSLSQEVLTDYAGDYIVLSRNPTSDNEFLSTEIWKNIPAVKNNRVIEIDTKAVTYSDPITLEYLLDIFKEGFLGSQ